MPGSPPSAATLEAVGEYRIDRDTEILHGIREVHVAASGTGRIDYDSERALQGFEQLKVATVVHRHGARTLQLSREVMQVDGLHQVNNALRDNGRCPPVWNDYPPELEAFYGRKVETVTWGELEKRGGEYFVKKSGKGGFQPMVARFPFAKSEQRDDVDPYNVCHLEDDDVVLASEPVNFIAEWRAFVVCHEVVDVRQYRGNWRAQYDRFLVSQAADAFQHPMRSYAIDFGLTDDGRTLVVETNAGYSLGAYGLMPDLYAKLLASAWEGVWG